MCVNMSTDRHVYLLFNRSSTSRIVSMAISSIIYTILMRQSLLKYSKPSLTSTLGDSDDTASSSSVGGLNTLNAP